MSGPNTPHHASLRVLLWLQDGVEADLLALQLRQAGLVVVSARSAEHVRNALSWAPADAVIVEVRPAMAPETLAFLTAQRTPATALYAVAPQGGLDRATELKLFALGCRDLWSAPLSAVAIAQQLLGGPPGATPAGDGGSAGKALRGFAGNFRYQPLTYVFQMCRRHRLNARLHARLGSETDDDWAVLLLRDGEVVDAETPGLRGKDAAVEWLAQAGQGFILNPLPPDSPELQRPDVVQEDIARLLMRAQHRRGGSPPPAVAALPVARIPHARAAAAATDVDQPRPSARLASIPTAATTADPTDVDQPRPSACTSAATPSGPGGPADDNDPPGAMQLLPARDNPEEGRREGADPGLRAQTAHLTPRAEPDLAPLTPSSAAQDADTKAEERPMAHAEGAHGVLGAPSEPPPAEASTDAGPIFTAAERKDESASSRPRKETVAGIPRAAPSRSDRAVVRRPALRGQRGGESTYERPSSQKAVSEAPVKRQTSRRGQRGGTAPGGAAHGAKPEAPGERPRAEGLEIGMLEDWEPQRLHGEAHEAKQQGESKRMAATAPRTPRHSADLVPTLERPAQLTGAAHPSSSESAAREDDTRAGVWVNPRSGLIHVGKIRAEAQTGGESPTESVDRPRVRVRHMREVEDPTPPPSGRNPRPAPASSGPSPRPDARSAPSRSESWAESLSGRDDGFEAPRIRPHPLAVAGWIALAISAVAIGLLATRDAPAPRPPSAISVASAHFKAGDKPGVEAALRPRFEAREASSVELRLLTDAMLANGRGPTDLKPVVEALTALAPSDPGATAWLAAIALATGDRDAFRRHLDHAEFLAPDDAGVQSLRAAAR